MSFLNQAFNIRGYTPRMRIAIGAVLLLLICALWWSYTGETSKSRIDHELAYLESCGELKTTSCPLQNLVHAAHIFKPTSGPLVMTKFDARSGQEQNLSFDEVKELARVELAPNRFSAVFRKANDGSALLASNKMSRVRMLDVTISDRPSDLIVQSTIKKFLYSRRQLDVPHVMLIGDSIRMRRSGSGYGTVVYNSLANVYDFEHIPHNTATASNVLSHLNGWLQRPLDIVLVNAGLHDLVRKTSKNGKNVISIADYKHNLNSIAAIIREHNIEQFAFVLSTPVIDSVYIGKAGPGNVPARSNQDVIAYNQAMSELAGELGIPLVDLFKPLMSCLHECISSKDGVHLTELGAKRAAKEIEEAIERLTVAL